MKALRDAFPTENACTLSIDFSFMIFLGTPMSRKNSK